MGACGRSWRGLGGSGGALGETWEALRELREAPGKPQSFLKHRSHVLRHRAHVLKQHDHVSEAPLSCSEAPLSSTYSYVPQLDWMQSYTLYMLSANVGKCVVPPLGRWGPALTPISQILAH